jgi:membrane-associated phospholipid phosphatase
MAKTENICHGKTWAESTVAYIKWRALDILFTSVLLIVGLTAQYYVTKQPVRFFVERDPFLSYPYNADKLNEVPTAIAGVLAIIPTLGIAYLSQVAACCAHYRKKREGRPPAPVFFWDLPLLALAQAIGMELLVTEVIKRFHSRYRPHFFAACNYKGYADGFATGNFTDYLAATTPGAPGDVAFCLKPKSEWTDAILSNPSGHASTIFAGWTVLALIMLFLLRSQRRILPIWFGKVWVLFLIILPTIGAELVTATRPRDYMHNFDDVLHGTIIGIGSGILAFFLNYGINPELAVVDPDFVDPAKPLKKRLTGKARKAGKSGAAGEEGEAGDDEEETTSSGSYRDTNLDSFEDTE